ncbi:MAG: SPOR domain-containing protein [Ignavibacteria bacterium]|nr:SPOR domain-containing protein [Ignavibacteria bacterium]
MKKILNIFFFAAAFLATLAYGQELSGHVRDMDIAACLRLIEQGKADSVKSILADLKKSHSDKPGVMVLEAVLTDESSVALPLFIEVYTKYPASSYAEIAMYRAYCYYYSIGAYKKADDLKKQMQSVYPSSAYLHQVTEFALTDTTRQDTIKPVLKVPVAEKNKPTAIKKNLFTIQVAAFMNHDNAVKLHDKLIDDGYRVKLLEKEVAGTALYIVYIESKTAEKAKVTAGIVNKKYKVKSRIIEPETK